MQSNVLIYNTEYDPSTDSNLFVQDVCPLNDHLVTLVQEDEKLVPISFQGRMILNQLVSDGSEALWTGAVYACSYVGGYSDYKALLANSTFYSLEGYLGSFFDNPFAYKKVADIVPIGDGQSEAKFHFKFSKKLRAALNNLVQEPDNKICFVAVIHGINFIAGTGTDSIHTSLVGELKYQIAQRALDDLPI